MKPIVLIHGYSAEGKDNSVETIYGTLPNDLKRTLRGSDVVDINLSRWISLSDGIALDDVSFALDRALKSREYRHLLKTGFHVIIHSTGALVVRNWMRLYERKPSPIHNLVYLAGANFGSGLAHIGRGELARWGRKIFQGTGRGVRVLNELEFGSTKTLDLHLHFLQNGCDPYDDYEVREYWAIGSQTLDELRPLPIRYVKEDSSDGTVRTSACNLNFNYISIQPTRRAYDLKVSTVDRTIKQRLNDKKIPMNRYAYEKSKLAADRRQIPFAVLYQTAHFGKDLGIVSGKDTRKKVLPLLEEALTTPHDEDAYRRVVTSWERVTARTFSRAVRLRWGLLEWNKQAQYEGHSQLIFRIRDQFGIDVDHYDITFRSETSDKEQPRLEKMIEDKHVNRHHRGTTTYYLRTQECKKVGGKRRWTNLLDTVAKLAFEVTGHEPKSDDIRYLPLTIDLEPEEIRRLVQPFRTTLIDVKLLRLPSEEVFKFAV